MDIRKTHLLSFSLLFCCLATSLFSQKTTVVKGIVIDADTKEPMAFVNVGFKGTVVGEVTDIDGKFVIEAKIASDILEVSFVGYTTQLLPVQIGMKQEINVALVSPSVILGEVVIKDKRGKYERKNNPAVDLMRNVVAHKNDNRMEGQEFYQFDRYEKVEFDINNFDAEKLKKKRAFKKFQFILDYIDTSDMNGKTFLPFFIQETASKVYYRKSPEVKKEYREGVKVTGIKDYVDLNDFTTMMDVLYQQVNIYDDNVRILDLSFVSPLNSVIWNATYRFYIMDTTSVINGMPCTKLSFYPVNNQNIAFMGDLYIVRDSSYAVAKADFGLTRQINVNFVSKLKLLQEFTKENGVWHTSKDDLMIDFAIFKKGTGIYGTRSVTSANHVFNKKQDESIYAGTEKVIAAKDAYAKTDTFWDNARLDTLTKKEQGIYNMIDTLQKLPTFRTVVNVMSLLFTGYKAFGPVDVGPVGAFYSFNPVEGFRLKVGGETNLKFQKKFMFAGYTAYGFEDQKFKYGGAFLYTFRNDFKVNPKHYFRLSYQHEVNLVGQILPFSSADNFFLSFQRGSIDRMLFLDRYRAEYFLELNNKMSWEVMYTNTNQRPIGSMELKQYTNIEKSDSIFLPEIQLSEVNFKMRFAPNEQYLQGRSYRIPVYNKYPVFTLSLGAGIKEDVIGGDVAYQKVSLGLFKRFYMSLFGSMVLETEAGKIWGKGVPYYTLYLPRANQSYAYRSAAFNMMNYQEFIADAWLYWNVEHSFNGFFFNKIPLLRKLKLREVITFKGVYGRLTDSNNPNLKENYDYIQFIKEDGVPINYTLEEKPYMEASIGVANIAKFLRIDFVRRLTYLDNPDVPAMFGVRGLGIRGKLKFEF